MLVCFIFISCKFQQGKYLPLPVKGEHAAHLCAYACIAGGRTVITAAPRFFAQLLGEADKLPPGEKVWGGYNSGYAFSSVR
jgi:(1->4)-alpha-D-glucan 1-alpha-D-glucosylmutase